ncbi:MAG: hypothetical protein ABSC64_19595 [Candidatus Korobacteraceae bacterium]|jgi:hypothetical protein
MLSYPRIFFLVSLLVLWVSAQVGTWLRRRRPLKDGEREDFNIVEAATLTLLGLIIGFSFSMATTRYDLRKNYEEAEANAIGTEYVRAGLLPAAEAAGVRGQLEKYLELRLRFYRTRSEQELQQINADTARLQSEMWSAVQVPAVAQPSPVIALAVAGMNDVLNSQGYTQAAWWNRIPGSAWTLMIAIAVCCNLLVGYGARSGGARSGLLFVLPLVISIAFLLISDIDSPRRGFIHVVPQNLESLSQSLPK